MAIEQPHEENTPAPKAEWEKAAPEQLPDPVYWPFFLALGFAFIFWGLLTMWLVLVAGCMISTIALIGWIKILNHEKNEDR